MRNPTSVVCYIRHKLSIRNLTTTITPPAEDDAPRLSNRILKLDPQALIQSFETNSVCWTPDLVNRILKRLWNHGPKAIQFFNLLERHPTYAHSATSFDHAIDIAARLRNYKTVWALVARMKKSRVGPNPKTFAIIIERYVSAGKPDKAIRVFLSMHEYGCQQDLNSFNMFLDVLCKSRRVEMAYNLFKVLKNRFRADTVSYNIIANGFCLKKRTPRALEVLREMVESGLEPTLKTYNVILNGYFKAGQIKEAWQFFLEMKRRKCEMDVVTYTTVVHGYYGDEGEIEKSLEVFERMGSGECLPNLDTYNVLISSMFGRKRSDDLLVAGKLLIEMVDRGFIPRKFTFNRILNGLLLTGNQDFAKEILRAQSRCGHLPRHFRL
ncbi:hypothetical protein E3N88_10612 [Mikania micrantha]|uniref:Pentacotripeptide-repeat region of PRORP domain-containing protein n=1 Tax=Mikania micrantha TaxID=192012 RepID=A0A5N6PB01_9ASTR|nr:hypothetical protein E3N88_10612 [Mikania micrantha]